MCTIEILAQCYDKFFEVIPQEKDNAEFAVEEMVSHVLMHLFGEAGDAFVEEVGINFSLGFHAGLRHCSIAIRAQCSCETFVYSPRSHEHIRYTMKETLSAILKEFFVTVKIDNVILRPSQRKCELDNTFSYMV